MVVKMMLSTSATTATASTTATTSTSSSSSSLATTQSSSKLIARTSSRSGNDLDEKENTDELSNLDSTGSGSNKLTFTNKVSITNTHNSTPAGELVDDDDDEEEVNPEHIKQEEAENDESSSMAEQADVGDKISLLEIDDVYEYWKKFDLSKFQADIKSQLQELNQNQPQNSESKAETKRYLAVQKSCTRLLQVLTNMPHPFPYMQRVPVESDNKKSQLEGESKKERQLIMELSEQVAQTSAENLELKSRLRISEAGVESYKRILADMQQELTDVKHKQLQAELNFVPKSTSINTPNHIDNKLPSSRSHSVLVKEENENNENGDEEENLIMDNDDDQQSSTTLMNDEEDDETPDDMSSSITPAVNSSIGHQIASSYQQHSVPQQLNTAEIAQKVRDLLSVHNIGQRIFAKSILGLSQGTVSELLSKPKQWDKLTEKGRESYRKMHVWSLNDRAIDALKAISPRKGNTTSSLSLPNSQYSSSFNTTTDNSIHNTNTGNNNSQRTPPLASSASNSSNNSQASSVSSSPSQSSSATPVPSAVSISHQGLSATTPQQLAATLVSLVQHQQSNNAEQRIAQLLLEAQKEIQAKSTTAAVMAAALQRNNDQAMLMFSNPFVNTNNSRSSPFSSNNPHLSNNSSQLRSGSSNNVVCSPPNSSSSTMSSPLGFNNHHSRGNKIKLDTSDYYDDADENGHHENDDGSSSSPQQQQHVGHFPLDLTIKTSNTANNKQVFSPIDQQVKKRKLDDETSINDNHVDNLLLLKQKTSSSTFKPISSNLIASTTTPPTANSVINPKCLLPPISQEQFDKYSSICTEELVRRVKDLLGKHSISQRLFGECILGLSQGSVSDLLARPKPWPMLTQKGREPFIRMQMFIDDPDSIRKLMQNQYNTISSSTPSVTPTPSVATSSSSKNSTSNATPPPVAQFIHHNNPLAAAAAAFLLNSIDNSNKKTVQVPTSANTATTATSLATTPNIIPYDISTLSGHISELNTEEVTNKVKESLLNNNIGQKLFGEAVLNLSQGTVSELLSKPKPWQTLSIKGREPYLRMYMWLSDKSRLDKLNEWKEEKNMMKLTQRQQQQQHQQQQSSQSSKLLLGDHNNSKLSNSNINAATSSFMNNSMLNSSDSNSNSAFNNSNGNKPKRRFIFSEEQKEQLMRAFKYDPYPAVNQMEALASKLGLQTRTVINWFHNHRMRIRYKTSTNQVNGDEMPFAPFVPRSRYVSNGSTPGGQTGTGGFKSSMSSSTNNTSSSSMLYLPAQSENDHNHSQNEDDDSRANGSQHHNMNMMSEYDEEDGVDRMNEYDEDDEDLVDENNNHVRGNNEDMMNGDGNMVNDSIGDEDEEEDEEDESGVNQDEINSLYIDNNHDETGSNEDEDENEDDEGGNENNEPYHMMKTHQVFHHQFPGSAYSSASATNKRRKANNPQKFNHSKLDAAGASADAVNSTVGGGNNASSQAAIQLEYA